MTPDHIPTPFLPLGMFMLLSRNTRIEFKMLFCALFQMMSHLPTHPSLYTSTLFLAAFILLTCDSAAAFKMHPHPAAFLRRGAREDSNYDNGMADVRKRDFENALLNKVGHIVSPCDAECGPKFNGQESAHVKTKSVPVTVTLLVFMGIDLRWWYFGFLRIRWFTALFEGRSEFMVVLRVRWFTPK